MLLTKGLHAVKTSATLFKGFAKSCMAFQLNKVQPCSLCCVPVRKLAVRSSLPSTVLPPSALLKPRLPGGDNTGLASVLSHAKVCGLSTRALAPTTAYHSAAATAAEPKQEEVLLPTGVPAYCSGCGIKLQREDPDSPGYFKMPKSVLEPTLFEDEGLDADEEAILAEADSRSKDSLIKDQSPPSTSGRDTESKLDETTEAALAPLNNLFEDKSLWKGKDANGQLQGVTDYEGFEDEEDDGQPRVLCARCFSLQHYGKVKSQKAEAALPGFDLGKKVGRKIALQKFRRPVVLCVVDVADFDGSLPRLALQNLLPRSMMGRQREGFRPERPQDNRSWNTDRTGGMEDCRLVLVANKADLLLPQAKQTRLEAWLRRRVQQAGLPRPDSVHLVSSTKAQGVKNLVTDLQHIAGVSGDVWVVGAQNAGKSSLINAMRRVVGRSSPKKDVTTAALPGTTLGTLRIDGIMQGRCRMFDTPGVPHRHQLSSRLTPDEVRLLLPRGRIRPRSFRIAAGQTVFVGGVARLDVLSSPGSTMYLTVWASNDIPCHFGKTEGAEERYDKLAGNALIPPLGDKARLEALGPLLPADLEVQGNSWKNSTTDIAIAGVGWVAIGVSGAVQLRVWTHKDVAVTVREALIPDFALEMEKPGLGNRTQAPLRLVKKAKGS